MSDRDRDTPYSVFEYPMDQIGVVPYEKHLIGSYSIDDRSYGHMEDVLVLVITLQGRRTTRTRVYCGYG
jgi:hypothetical protein